MHHLAYITISILMKHSIMIRYSITVVIYCHVNMHCRSLRYASQIPTVCMCVPEYFSSQYPNNANPSIFSTVNKLHYTLCSFVHVCLCRTDGQLSEFANVIHPLFFSPYYHQTIQRVCTFAYTHMSMKPETLINSCH